MDKICMGCGEVLQSEQKDKKGFVLSAKISEAIYCERCFRLKHYHEVSLDSLEITNDEILKQADAYETTVYYFVDLLHLSEESISFFRRVRSPKVLVLTKVDYIPRSISLERLINRIRKVYHVEEKIIPVSVKISSSVLQLWNDFVSKKRKKVVFLGMTNVGKSSLLNQLSVLKEEKESPILVSEMPNTTQAFLPWKIEDITIYDAPGFNYSFSYDPVWNMEAVPKKYLRPITEPMKGNTKLLLHHHVLLSQNLEKNSVTFYGSNALLLEKRYQEIEEFSHIETLSVPKSHDLVFPGIGFFAIRKDTVITLQSSVKLYYEVRPSLIGGQNDTN